VERPYTLATVKLYSLQIQVDMGHQQAFHVPLHCLSWVGELQHLR